MHIYCPKWDSNLGPQILHEFKRNSRTLMFWDRDRLVKYRLQTAVMAKPLPMGKKYLQRLFQMPTKHFKQLSRGEICMSNFIPPKETVTKRVSNWGLYCKIYFSCCNFWVKMKYLWINGSSQMSIQIISGNN